MIACIGSYLFGVGNLLHGLQQGGKHKFHKRCGVGGLVGLSERIVVSGLVVTDIEDGSLAEVSGLQPGDLLLELNRQPIPNFSTFQRLAEPLRSTDLALLLINRQGSLLYIPIQTE